MSKRCSCRCFGLSPGRNLQGLLLQIGHRFAIVALNAFGVRTRRKIGTILLSVFISGCVAVGPDYQPPKLPVPAAWGEGQGGAVRTQNIEDTKWWTYFRDPLLNSLIERAAASNLDLLLAEKRVMEARATRDVAGAGLWPSVNTSGTYTRRRFSKNGFSSGAGSTGSTTSGTGTSTTGGASSLANAFTNKGIDIYQGGFDASWELDLFGRVRRSIEAADADIDAAVESHHAALVTLLGDIARNYIQLRSLQQQIAIVRKNVETQEDTLRLTRARNEAGFDTDLAVSRAEAQAASTKSQLPPLESSLKQTMHRIEILLAQNPGTLDKELSAAAPLPEPPLEVLMGLPNDLLRRRPDIRQAERELAAATARIGVATADLYPRFSLAGTFGLQSIKFTDLAKGGSQFWSIGPTLTYPLFDAGRIRANIRVQNARQEQALVAYEQALLNALEDVENALTAYGREQSRRSTLADAVNSNQRALNLANDLYTKGLTDFLAVLDAERSLLQSQNDQALSQAAVASDLIALYKALGGGWEAMEASNLPPTPTPKTSFLK